MPALSRRDWLRTTAAGLTAGVAGTTTRAADPPRHRFGFGQYGMMSATNAEYITACARIGYDCVELTPQPGRPADPKALSATDRQDIRSRIADAGLVLTSLLVGMREPGTDATHKQNLETIKVSAELGHTLSPNAAPVLVTNLGGKPDEWEKVRDGVADRLRGWAETAKAAKVVIALKPHVKSALHSPEGGLWVLEKVNSPALKLAYDYSHYTLQKRKLAETFTALIPHSALVHLKDAKGTPDKVEFLLPGEGDTDYREYAKLLAASPYRGAMIVEVSSMISSRPGYDGLAAAKTCYAKLAPAFGRPAAKP